MADGIKRHKILTGLAILILAFILLGRFWPAGEASTSPLLASDRPLIFAHGGGQGLAQPNSLAALEAAKAEGTDFLEVDVHLTRDGHLVIIHDETVDRTTDGTGRVEDMTLAEVKALRLKGSDTLTIPTLEEALISFPKSRWVMEIKLSPDGLTSALCETLRKHKTETLTLVASFHKSAMKQFRSVCPEVLTSMHRGEVTRFVILQKLGLSRLATLSGDAFHVPERRGIIRVVTPGFVRAAHERGYEVHVWTVNERHDMARLFAMGVDGVFTDFPGRGLDEAKNASHVNK